MTRRAPLAPAAAPLLAVALAFAPAIAPARAAFDPDEDRAVRITAEAGFGILGGLGGAFAGGLLGWGICAAGGEDVGFGCLLGFVIGGLAGEFVGIGLGTYGGGNLAGGNGGLGWTFLGEAGGALLTTGLLFAFEGNLGDAGWLVLMSVLPLTGAVLGYELSTTREGPRTVTSSFTFRF